MFPNESISLRALILWCALLAFSAAGVRASGAETRGWGSSWTVPHTAAEKAERQEGQKLKEAMHARDWPAVERMLKEATKRNPQSPDIAFMRALVSIQRKRYDEALANVDLALSLVPKESKRAAAAAYVVRSYVGQLKGSYRDGRADLEKAVALDRDSVLAQNGYAWVLATSPDASVRDGRKAVQVARTAIKKDGKESAGVLDTLAAAEAEAGDFAAAVRDEERALALATDRRELFQKHLELYRRREPLHVAPDPPREL